MKNSEMPAMPLSGDAYVDIQPSVHEPEGRIEYGMGLTKREYFACEAMKALLMQDSELTGHNNLKQVRNSAYKMADLMLEE